jgi:hypothetical protein
MLLYGAVSLSPFVDMNAVRESPGGLPNHCENEKGNGNPRC